jgi:transposase
MGRGRFTPESKLEAVKLVRDRGTTAAQAARDLGLHENVLRKWVKDTKEHGTQAFPGQGRMRPDDAEVARLKRELAKVRTERDILRKPSPTLRGNRSEVPVHREAPRGMAGW